jgi:hypothetical protein
MANNLFSNNVLESGQVKQFILKQCTRVWRILAPNVSPWSSWTKGTIRPNSSYHAPKATQKHLAKIFSNHGHTFLSQFVLSRPHKL